MIIIPEELEYFEKFIEYSGEEYLGFQLLEDDPPDLHIFQKDKSISVEVSHLYVKGGEQLAKQKSLLMNSKP